MRKLLAIGAASLLFAACQTPTATKTTTHKKVSIDVPKEVQIELSVAATYATGKFDEGAAEIIDYDAASKTLVFTNADENALVFLDISNPKNPREKTKVSFSSIKGAGGVNSVAVKDGVVAAAVENDDKQDIGFVVFLNTQGKILSYVRAGALPDMVTFTPDGNYVIVANEGEPNDSYDVDPLGSVSIIDISNSVSDASLIPVNTVIFDEVELGKDVRITALSPDTTPAQDLEPEYIAVDADSKYAYVAMQENNAIAKIEIATGKIEMVKGLGYKDHSVAGAGLDATKGDKKVKIRTWPLRGLYMPDAITTYKAGGHTFIISANEGDGREYDDYTDETKVGKVKLDKKAFPNAKELQSKENLGGTLISSMDGDIDDDGDYDALYTFGARSFTIWDSNLNIVYDSGDALEQVAWTYNDEKYFNTSNDKDKFDNRSPKKGPEPEGVVTGVIEDNTFAFVLLERIGGVAVYNVSNPYEPLFNQYINNRRFGVDVKSKTAGDLGPEDAVFISAAQSPNGKNLLAVANEVSGTVTIYNIDIMSQM